VIAVAAPVIGRDGVARVAVGVQGPSSRLTAKELPTVAARVLEAAEELSVLPILDRL
jgi:DNA-binding IclR family transcriptional regulator